MKRKKKENQRKPGHLLGRTHGEADAANMMMFDPGEQHLDLTKSEKLRTTALLMAINYVRETICNDAELYRAMRQDGKNFVPATVPYIIECSVNFEEFLLGSYSRTNVAMVKRGMEMEKQRNEAARSQPANETAQATDAVDPSATDPGTPTPRDAK